MARLALDLHHPALVDRIGEKFVFDPDGCWRWTAHITRGGYGQMWLSEKNHPAHRVMYEMLVGPIPEGLTIDHLCRNRACVNPGHMEPVTHRENTLRGENPLARNKRKTHCVRGHEFSHANTLIDRGHRQCRECVRANSRERSRRYRARRIDHATGAHRSSHMACGSPL